jgi:carbonic anhydrase
VVIDLAEIPHADTTGTKSLMELVDSLERRGSRVVLKGANERLEQLLAQSDLSLVPRKRFAFTESDVLELLQDNRQDAVRSRLLAGVERFSRDLHPRFESLYERLGEGQKPHTLFVTCSDSRITPNQITATDPGELFIVRNVGNAIPDAGDGITSVGAAIEYSIGVLGVSQIVVCGHSKCGAIAACFADPATLKDYPNVSLWLKGIREGLPREFDGSNLDQAARGNALCQLERLLTYPIVRERVEAGTLRLSAWFFDVSKGELSEWSPSTDTFVPIASAEHEALEKVGATVAKARANKA